MAATVNGAFDEFIRETVNLETSKTQAARKSRDNLFSNIKSFSEDDDFFSINGSRCLNFGSFQRHTKIQPLDDIDMMICIAGSGDRKFTDAGYGIYYMGANQTDKRNGLNTRDTDHLNSTKVINRFISKLSRINDYSKAEMHKNHEAATLKLKSYDWNFDIVPCFYCSGDFYLIPDGNGNWKKTDPRVDNDRTTNINQKHNGKLLSLIRLVKFWNYRHITYTIGSYMLECMILNRYENMITPDDWWIDLQFRDTMNYLSTAIYSDVYDPKGIQGNINDFTYSEKSSISEAFTKAYIKSKEAAALEHDSQREAIKKWRDVFGPHFPDYSGA